MAFTTREGFVPPNNAASAPAPFSPASISGVTGYWNFNVPASVTTAGGVISAVADLSGGNHHMDSAPFGALPAYFASGGRNGHAYAAFAANLRTALCTSSAFTFASSTAFSIAGWVNAAAQARGTVIGRDIAASPNVFLCSGETAGAAQSKVQLFCETDGALSTTNAYDSTWHFVVGIYTQPNINIYVDGTLSQTISDGPASIATSSIMSLGCINPTNPTLGLTGSLEWIATYNKALSSDDIAALYGF